MADRSGYIGRAPADSAVTVARQTFSPTGVTTDFTFASGYVSGYFDIYLNGVKMIEGSDYTSTDGSTFSILNGGAENGDVIEAVAYKAFNAATIDSAPGNLSVGGNLTVTGSASFGSVAAGTSVSFATTAYALEGTPDISVRNVTGVAATFTGVVTLEDVTNIDSVGIVTAQSGINIVGGGLTVTGVSTFFSDVSIADKIIHTGDTNTAIRFPAVDTITAETAGSERLRIDSNGDVGVGIADPQERLHVARTVMITGNTPQIRLNANDSDADDNDRTMLGQATSAGNFVTTAVDNDTILRGTTTGNLLFGVGTAERLRITSDGEVRVGAAFSVGQAGIVTATEFHGSGANLTNLPASGDSNDITACLFI